MWSSADGTFRRWGVEEMGNSGDGNFTRWRVQEMGSSRDGDCSSYLKKQSCSELSKTNFGIGFASIRAIFSILENSAVILKNVEKFQEIFVYIIEPTSGG